MRAPEAFVRVVGMASFATFTWGCQILGGVESDLVLSVAGSGGPVGVEGEPVAWEASDPGPGAKPMYTLPDWLTLKNPTLGMTIQQGAAVKTGYGPDETRPRNVGKKWGLAVEKTRTNYVVNSSWGGVTWAPGAPEPMVVTPNQEDPAAEDGVDEGVRFDSAGNQQSHWTKVADAGLRASTWARGVIGSIPYAYFAYGDNWQNVGGDEWQHYEVPFTGGEKVLRFETQGFGPDAITTPTSFIAYGAQVEEGKYPSSFIPTTGVSRIREADIVHVEERKVAKDGWFAMTIRFAPHYATNEQEVPHDIINLYKNQIFVRLQSNPMTEIGTLVMRVPGSSEGVADLSITGLKWTRDEPLTVVAWSAPDGRFLSIEGAVEGNGEASSGVPAKPLVEPVETLSRLLGEKNGAQESADLQYIEFR